jgi:dihydroorotate dehydrogenase
MVAAMAFLPYRKVLRPLLFSLDPEMVHHLAMSALRLGGRALRPFTPAHDPRLARTVFGVTFPNPVGLAAGFDKNAVALPAWESLGFGFVEAGTITARAQPGNPKPRIFRVPEFQGLINRLGFNNEGADAVAARLQRLKDSSAWPRIPVGINIGKSKVTPLEEATADYLLSFQRLQSFGDYFVLNVSSPNTPGLRTLQDRAALDELLGHIQTRNTTGKPVLVKIAPDLEWAALEEILALAQEHAVAGLIATNTTIDQGALPAQLRRQGGLSGAPLRARATEIVRFIAERSAIPIVAAGGIMCADDALEKFDAGAALVQLYTGFVYEGPRLIREICAALLARSA